MSQTKLNMQKIIDLKPPFWSKLAVKIYDWIKGDMEKGKVQEYTKAYSYQYSKQYHYYKTHWMKKKTDGQRLKGYTSGVSVKSNSSTPNMFLTGELIQSLKYHHSGRNYVQLRYDPNQAKKLKGNEDLGRNVRTLNDKNKARTVKMIEQELNQNSKKWAHGAIIINIG